MQGGIGTGLFRFQAVLYRFQGIVGAGTGDDRHPARSLFDHQLDHPAMLVMVEGGALSRGTDRHYAVGALFNVPVHHASQSRFIQSAIGKRGDQGNNRTMDHTNSFSLSVITSYSIHYTKLYDGLSLAALSQLQQEPAVKLEGRLGAELPVRITPEGVEIRAGRLRNQGQARLDLLPSPGVESWLNSQPQLARVGDYLRQMTVQQLDARLDLSPKGQLQLDAKLEGRSLGRSRQPLRLNYHHVV